MNRIKTMALAMMGVCCLPAIASAAPVYQVENGKLVAIRGIIGDPFYIIGLGIVTTDNGYQAYTDIEFLDGTCAEVISGCLTASVRSTSARRYATIVPTYLVDNIDIGGAIYNFSSDPSLVNGCSDKSVCTIYAVSPGRSSATEVYGSIFTNFADKTDTVAAPVFDLSLDTRTITNATYARMLSYTIFNEVAAVPEPSTWAMMIVGFGLVGSTMRRRKTTVATRVRFG